MNEEIMTNENEIIAPTGDPIEQSGGGLRALVAFGLGVAGGIAVTKIFKPIGKGIKKRFKKDDNVIDVEADFDDDYVVEGENR